jgi:hypothetical protein
MAIRDKQELLDKASEFRAMASVGGSDVRLYQALLLVAEEFEREAAKLNSTDQFEPSPPAGHPS